jgi:hypothetical protein
MNVPLLGRSIDERFLTHRLRSTSLAGVIGGVTTILLFAIASTSITSGAGTCWPSLSPSWG